MKTEPKLILERADLDRLRELVRKHDSEKDDSKAGHLFTCIENEVETLIDQAFTLGVGAGRSLSS